MKAKIQVAHATIRMLLAAIPERGGFWCKQARELGDDEILKVLARRRESAAKRPRSTRRTAAARLAAEGTCRSADHRRHHRLLSDAEVADVVDTAIAQVAEDLGERPSMKQMGQVMKAATEIAGGKADGARLSAAVRDRL